MASSMASLARENRTIDGEIPGPSDWLPYFPTVVETTEKTFRLFLLTHLKPILYKDDPVSLPLHVPIGTHFKKASYIPSLFSKPHYFSMRARSCTNCDQR